ncbi:MAG: hypothetical protein GXP29_04605, partial [Planctomycetes bacterium]|nr:hypothetical protein [Planctomycetota bacterium]
MFSNTFQRFSKVMLVASIVLTFVAVAHADGGKKKSPAKTTMTLEDALHLRIDVIEVASKTLAPTTDQQ